MLNQVILVGRIARIEKLEDYYTNNNTLLRIVVPNSFKNEDGIYDNDYIDTILNGTIASNVVEYCKIGDLVGIKGRMSRTNLEKDMRIVAEKVTFLSSRNNEQ